METICAFLTLLHQPRSPGSQPRLGSLLGGELLCLGLLSHPPHPPCLRGPRGSTIGPSSTGHGSPGTSLLFCLHPINHLFLAICMAALLHLASQGSFLVSLLHLTLASWVTLDSPATTTGSASETYLSVLQDPCLLTSLPIRSASQALPTAPSCKSVGGALGHSRILEVLVDVRTAKRT